MGHAVVDSHANEACSLPGLHYSPSEVLSAQYAAFLATQLYIFLRRCLDSLVRREKTTDCTETGREADKKERLDLSSPKTVLVFGLKQGTGTLAALQRQCAVCIIALQ